MGQAKARGTREHRVAQATRRSVVEDDLSKEAELAILDVTSNRRLRLLEIWSSRVKNLLSDDADSQSVAFCKLLNFMWLRDWHGACHSSSAVFYMLLAEVGLTPTLCIGEVTGDSLWFDHSWVALNDLIFDAAVSLPSKNGNGAFAGGPIFRSIDLSTGRKPRLTYGAKSKSGLSSPAREVSQVDLSRYSQLQIADGVPPDGTIWVIAALLCSELGLTATAHDLENRYGSVNRTIFG